MIGGCTKNPKMPTYLVRRFLEVHVDVNMKESRYWYDVMLHAVCRLHLLVTRRPPASPVVSLSLCLSVISAGSAGSAVSRRSARLACSSFRFGSTSHHGHHLQYSSHQQPPHPLFSQDLPINHTYSLSSLSSPLELQLVDSLAPSEPHRPCRALTFSARSSSPFHHFTTSLDIRHGGRS